MRVNLDREKKFRFDSNFHPGLQFIPTTVYARVGLIPTLVSINRGDKSAIFHGEIEVCLGRVEFYKREKEKEIKITGRRKVSMIGKRGYLKRTVNEIEIVSWRLNPLPR